MTKRELFDRMAKMHEDEVVVLATPDGGWSNIATVESNGSVITLTMEKGGLFHDN